MKVGFIGSGPISDFHIPALKNNGFSIEALGTTKKDAGSKEAQYKVDFTYQYNFALSAAENKVKKILLVSSVGANDKSNFFYPKIRHYPH